MYKYQYIHQYIHTYIQIYVCIYKLVRLWFLIPATMQQRAVDETISPNTTVVSTPPSQSPDWEDQPPQYKDIVHTFPVSSCKSSARPVLSGQPVAEVVTTENTMENRSVSASSAFVYWTRLFFVPLYLGIAFSNGYTNFFKTVRVTPQCTYKCIVTDCAYLQECMKPSSWVVEVSSSCLPVFTLTLNMQYWQLFANILLQHSKTWLPLLLKRKWLVISFFLWTAPLYC